MFTSFVFAALLASPLFVLAEPTPSAPGPGEVFKVGQTCHTAWDADTAANSPWKIMNIELMSGSNLDMKHVTTLTPKPVDGTISGKLDFPCPEVNPYSAIYFYQFSSPNADGVKTWTTRFTIADASGKSVPPANDVQPGGERISWGIGTLANPANAVAAPVGGGGSDASSDASTGANSSSTSKSSSLSSSSSSSSFSTSTLAPTPQSTSASKSPASTNAANTANSPSANGALGMAVDVRVWGVLAGVAALISIF